MCFSVGCAGCRLNASSARQCLCAASKTPHGGVSKSLLWRKLLRVELVPVERWRTALCGIAHYFLSLCHLCAVRLGDRRCPRRSDCNFVHPFRNPRALTAMRSRASSRCAAFCRHSPLVVRSHHRSTNRPRSITDIARARRDRSPGRDDDHRGGPTSRTASVGSEERLISPQP